MLFAELDHFMILRERSQIGGNGPFVTRLSRQEVTLGGVVSKQLVVDGIDQARNERRECAGGPMNGLNVLLAKADEFNQVREPIAQIRFVSGGS
jgi:hypothetical protein